MMPVNSKGIQRGLWVLVVMVWSLGAYGEAAWPEPKGHTVWSVGQLDGRPEDEHADRVAEEFSVLRAEGAVVTVRRQQEFPQVIDAGQSLVIHLGVLPREHLALHMAVVSRAAEEVGQFATDYAGRRLRILFNGHEVWHRWYVDGHALIETVVPPAMVEREANVLVIENTGERVAAFDAVRLERYAPGALLLAAPTGMERRAGSVAADVSRAVVRPSFPEAMDHEAADVAPMTPPDTWRDAAEAYRALLAKSKDGKPDAAALRWTEWNQRIEALLRRGVTPWIDVRDRGVPPELWHEAAARYGGMVEGWIVPDAAAAESIRRVAPEARIYGGRLHSVFSDAASGEEAEGANGGFVARHGEFGGGRIDRLAGEQRARLLRSGRHDRALGLRTYAPGSTGDVILQRRNGRYAAETMVQWWMAGGDLAVLESDAGGDFFPDIHDQPSAAWATVRLLFGLSEGTPRRAVCAVTPEGGGPALGASSWVAVENSPELVTLVFSFLHADRGRRVSVSVPVPWRGPTEGRVEGYDLPPWQRSEPVEIRPYTITRDADSAGTSGYGHVRLTLEASGIRRLRLWPAGHPPMDKAARLKDVAAQPLSPETLHGVFRFFHVAPPPGLRYEPLRKASDLVGNLGGSHIAEVRPATRGTLPAWVAGEQPAARASVSVRNVAPFEETSLFVRFAPEDREHGLRLRWWGEALRPARGIMVYVRAHMPPGPPPSRAAPPPPPARFWLGTLAKRHRIELTPDRWHLLVAPVKGLLTAACNPYHFHLWADAEETRAIEYEFNGFTAFSETDARGGAPLAPSRVAVRSSEAGDRMWMLVEGPPGQPTAQTLRLERPAMIGNAVVALPEDYAGVQVKYRPAAQWLDVRLPALPAVDEGVSETEATALFRGFQPDPAHSRVLIDIELER